MFLHIFFNHGALLRPELPCAILRRDAAARGRRGSVRGSTGGFRGRGGPRTIRVVAAASTKPRPVFRDAVRVNGTHVSNRKGHGSAAGANLLKFGLVGPPQKGHGSAAGANLLKSGLRADQIC